MNLSSSSCSKCPGARLAAFSPPEQQRRKGSYASLAALLLPGIAFAGGLFLLREHAQFTWIKQLSAYPWQIWVIAFCGLIATGAGIGDWLYHRLISKCSISKKERNCELLALAGGGVPLFGLMSLASISSRPINLLLPVLIVLLFTVALICYDEFIFHRRRCGRLETVLHRLLVFGNGTAWFAWAHWCFVKGGAYA